LHIAATCKEIGETFARWHAAVTPDPQFITAVIILAVICLAFVLAIT
jgi:hypothetical protein